MLFTGGSDKVVATWDLDKEENTPLSIKTDSVILNFQLLNDEKHLFIGLFSGDFHVIDLDTRKEIRYFSGHKLGAFASCFIANSNLLFVGAGDGTLSIWDTKDFQLLASHQLGKGKIRAVQPVGDDVFIAPDTEIKFKENKKKKGLSNVINRNLTLKGRLLAKIRKNLARPIQIRTPNAIVAVKGTEFVTEFIQGITNVGTIKGLVSMTSIVNNKSVELKEGTMSSVNIEGSDSEIGWNISQSNGWAVLSGALDSYSNFCIQDDCWTFNMYDGNGGDGWFETNYYIFYSNTNELISSGTLIDGNYCSVDIQIGDSVSCQNVYGCTDYNACNYNCEANTDDFSCEYADPYYVDCDGVCINDFDQDGICDELETNPCEQYPNPGPCFAAITVYFFNQQSSQCEETTWGGCDGVVPFWTLQECENECENNSSNEDFDSKPIIIKTINILGQKSNLNGLIINIFDDGTVEKIYN